ncbi:hypothetical protein RHMOL_Rhmol04G0185900 [Rhododendron molle]|uniref:Uncharacterized protein n=1 Tax=Rhododendron molle TaxID=49168 RepID=A0ACC0P4B4_RHOML|nr:hypothetical protein RHMOL_Rhmol04G0185900 [Rhododendron molle]
MLLTGRMLLCVRERPSSESQNHSSLQRQFSHGHSQKSEDGGFGSGTRISHFLPTSRRIVQFSNGKGPGPTARIVYIDGAFDLFHAGHVEILRLARGLGDFLLVGIHTDQTVRKEVGDRKDSRKFVVNVDVIEYALISNLYSNFPPIKILDVNMDFVAKDQLTLKYDTTLENRSLEYHSFIMEFRAFLSDCKDVLDEVTTMKLLERCFAFPLSFYFASSGWLHHAYFYESFIKLLLLAQQKLTCAFFDLAPVPMSCRVDTGTLPKRGDSCIIAHRSSVQVCPRPHHA